MSRDQINLGNDLTRSNLSDKGRHYPDNLLPSTRHSRRKIYSRPNHGHDTEPSLMQVSRCIIAGFELNSS